MFKHRFPHRAAQRNRSVLSRGNRRHESLSRRRNFSIEPLEPRIVLSATLFQQAEIADYYHGFDYSSLPVTQIELDAISSNDMIEALAREIDRAFERVSDLSQYTAEQMAAATQWVVRTFDTITNDLAAALGSGSVEPFGEMENTYIYTPISRLNIDGSNSSSAMAISALSGNEDVQYFYPVVPIDLELHSLPNDPYLEYQWHLQNVGQEVGNPDNIPVFSQWGEDVHIEPVWDNYTGEGVTIAIVDDSLEPGHPDLQANYEANLARDFNDIDYDPSPEFGDSHGTAVAGVAAGVGNNGIGITGAAYDASLTGLRLISGITVPEIHDWSTDPMISEALFWKPQDIDIYNNSWGAGSNTPLFMPGPLTTQSLQWSRYMGREDDARNPLGTILVFSSGNGGPSDDANYTGFSNSRYTIAVNATAHDGTPTEYSEYGASILVSAPSGADEPWGNASGIWTTDNPGIGGYNFEDSSTLPVDHDGDFFPDLDYTSRFNGTSSSAPLVSGIIALMLEANPNLTDRDVEQILAQTARQNDPESGFWVRNGAGFQVHDIYGFGTVDARAAVEMAEDWVTVAPEVYSGLSGYIGIEIPAMSSISISATFDDNNVVEWMDLNLGITEPLYGQAILLESPDGTLSILASPNSNGDYPSHTFTSVRHMGELLRGTWTITVINFTDAEAFLGDVTIQAWGTEAEGEGRVSGLVGLDLNANGKIDVDRDGRATEPWAEEITVYVDLNENGLREFFEPSMITGADGAYYFDLDPHPMGGEYLVRVDMPGNMHMTSGENVFATQITEGSRITAVDFTLDPDPIQVSGTVFADLDGNGQIDTEPLLNNFTVYVDVNLDGKPNAGDIFTTTDSNGEYQLLIDLGSEFYTIAVIDQDGLISGAPERGFYREYLVAGDIELNFDFGMIEETDDPGPVDPNDPDDPDDPVNPGTQVGAIAGMVYHDIDEDGFRDAGESGLANWFVYLDLDNNGVVGTNDLQTRTNNNGEYLFGFLPYRQYSVRTIAQPSWVQTAPGDDGSHLVDLAAPIMYRYNDFGFGGTIDTDYGDLPAPYPTLAEDDGPSHPIQSVFYLGSGIDGEFDGQPDSDALGDDVTGIADEDGVVLLDELKGNTWADIEVTAHTPGGYLQGWMDFNRDGDWDDAGERIFEDVLLNAGPNVLTIHVPTTVIPGPIYSRFRYSEYHIESYTGPAVGGEVEDYVFIATGNLPPGAMKSDFNQDGKVDGLDLGVWETGFGTLTGADSTLGDTDGDGDVDGQDFLNWQLGFGSGSIGGEAAGAAAESTVKQSVTESLSEAQNLIKFGQNSTGLSDRPLASPLAGDLAIRNSMLEPSTATDSAAAIRLDLALSDLEETGLNLPEMRSEAWELARMEGNVAEPLLAKVEESSHDLAFREIKDNWVPNRPMPRPETIEHRIDARLPIPLASKLNSGRKA